MTNIWTWHYFCGTEQMCVRTFPPFPQIRIYYNYYHPFDVICYGNDNGKIISNLTDLFTFETRCYRLYHIQFEMWSYHNKWHVIIYIIFQRKNIFKLYRGIGNKRKSPLLRIKPSQTFKVTMIVRKNDDITDFPKAYQMIFFTMFLVISLLLKTDGYYPR